MTDEEIIAIWAVLTASGYRHPWTVTEFGRQIIDAERERCALAVEAEAKLWGASSDFALAVARIRSGA